MVYHFAELVHRQAEQYGNRTALLFRNRTATKWDKISWNEFSHQVMLTAKAMAEFDIQVQERIGVYSQNMPQCYYTDYGAYANRAVVIPMYATNSPAQVEYIVNDAQIKTLLVGEQVQYNNAYKVLRESKVLKRIIIFDRDVTLNPEDADSIYFDDFLRLGDNAHAETTVKVRMHEALPEDQATIMYTSGTTGNSKGVILHHSQYLEAMRIHIERLPAMNEKDISMCFLPLTHIFEKAWSALCITCGVRIAINHDPKQIQQSIKEIHPTLMCNVPRFWEKVYVGVEEKIDNFPGFLRKFFRRAIKVGHRYVMEYRNKEIRAPFPLRFSFGFYNMFAFNLLKRVLGIDKGRFFPTAGAPLSDAINEFLQSVNIPIIYGYGLTETTATVCCFPFTRFTIGSIGTLMPDVQVKIDEATNEILVKGKTITTGYFNRPEENQKSFTEDGFFRTGDAGRLEGDTLFFIERIKDLYKTSNGKYIAPQAIEQAIINDRFVEQIAVIGDQHKFVSALIYPDYTQLEAFAKEKGIPFANRQELVDNPTIHRLIESRVEICQKDLASFEKIKRFTLLTEAFTIEGRELTDTLKLRRPVINEKYKNQIDKMYQD